MHMKKAPARLGESLGFVWCCYSSFLADLNGVVNNAVKGINACGNADNLDAKVVNIDVDLVVPCAADDLAGVVVNLNGDISVIVGELYVLDTGSYANAGKLIFGPSV